MVIEPWLDHGWIIYTRYAMVQTNTMQPSRQHTRITGSAIVLHYNGHSTANTKILGQIGSAGISPNTWNNTFVTFWLFLFFSQSAPQVKPRLWRTRLMAQTTCFRARRCLLGLEWGVTPFGENMPQPSQNWAWIGNFKPNCMARS